MTLGDAAGDDVDGGVLDALLMVGDAAGVDDVAESHAVTRETLAMPMTAHTTAVRAWVAIRELNMVLIGLVNHHSARAAQVFPGSPTPRQPRIITGAL